MGGWYLRWRRDTFLPHDEVLAWMTKDADFGEEDARLMLVQVEGRDYSPPRRDRILQWQSEQEFPILPNVDDPDCGNLYRNLNFPDAIYQHIGHYREQKAEARRVTATAMSEDMAVAICVGEECYSVPSRAPFQRSMPVSVAVLVDLPEFVVGKGEIVKGVE